MASGNAWPFFLFWLNQPEVGSESEPKNLYWSSWPIGVLLSCNHRTVSSCWSSASLVSSSVIFELACTNFLSAFWQWSHSVEGLFSAILTLSVRLSWRSLDFLVQLRGCLILYVVNYVQPHYSEGLFDLPGRYFHHWRLWCFYYV